MSTSINPSSPGNHQLFWYMEPLREAIPVDSQIKIIKRHENRDEDAEKILQFSTAEEVMEYLRSMPPEEIVPIGFSINTNRLIRPARFIEAYVYWRRNYWEKSEEEIYWEQRNAKAQDEQEP